jgi:hypothetical protein
MHHSSAERLDALERGVDVADLEIWERERVSRTGAPAVDADG